MKSGIYRLLDQDARAWWYFKQLRRRGMRKEARKQERASIRSHVKDIREALANDGYFTQGRGGWALHIRDGKTLSGYGCDDSFAQVCRSIFGGWDSRTIPDDKIYQTVGFPIHSTNPAHKGTGAFDFEYWRVNQRRYAALGAIVYESGARNP